LLCALVFVTRNMLVRAALVIAGAVILFMNISELMNIYQGQINFSARERMTLLQYGWDLWQQRFWTGWGWGSTNSLAAAAPTIQTGYPHFHDAYVQMLAELGVFGAAIIAGFFYYAVSRLVMLAKLVRQPQVTALIAIGTLAIATSSIFDAMLFGADRAIQIVILLAMMVRTSALALEAVRDPGHAAVSEQAAYAAAPAAR
jgi:O-antigen ligase